MARRADTRVSMGLRIPAELHRELTETAEAHGLAANWIVVKALEDFLPRMVAPDELRLTR